jgi:hypothetical protein
VAPLLVLGLTASNPVRPAVWPTPGPDSTHTTGDTVTDPTARQPDDMRRQIVLREINQGALAGMQSEISEQAADLVLAALDRYDTWAAGKAAARLSRIAEAHSKHVGSGGLTDGDCNECGHRWPCPTYTWATTDRDQLATWDPADDDTEQQR